MSTLAIAATAFIALGGVLYNPIQTMVFTTAGFRRVVQSIDEFPYTCRKLVHPDLEACEDIFIDEIGRNAYLACSSSTGRQAWTPATNRLNSSARGLTDHFSVLSLDEPGSDGLFGLRTLRTTGYQGARGGNVIDLHGFDIEDLGNNLLRFFVVNHRPPVDADGTYQDAVWVGANSTVEVFETKRGSKSLTHKQTYYDPLIQTPNRVAADGKGGFVLVNDKSGKVGLRRDLDIFIGGGTLVHCIGSKCEPAGPKPLAFPNGISKSHKDGRYYVPSTLNGIIYVYEKSADGKLTEVDQISTGMPMDNLHIDAAGDIYAASFPKLFDIFHAYDDPNYKTIAAVNRIRRSTAGWEVKKILEDKKSAVLPAITSAAHDVKTGRLFLGSVISPWTTVCDPK